MRSRRLEAASSAPAWDDEALVTEAVNEHLRPLRQRRRELATDPGYLHQILDEGNTRANHIADHTLQHVLAVMDMTY